MLPIEAKIREAEAREAAMTPNERTTIYNRHIEEATAVRTGSVTLLQRVNIDQLRAQCTQKDQEALQQVRRQLIQAH